jgi:uncharacterized protein (DUF779 family)
MRNYNSITADSLVCGDRIKIGQLRGVLFFISGLNNSTNKYTTARVEDIITLQGSVIVLLDGQRWIECVKDYKCCVSSRVAVGCDS